MAENSSSQRDIPVLTDVVTGDPAAETKAPPYPSDLETLVAELQTKLASSAFALTEELLRSSFAEMEATLFEQISARLRQELPELIDSVLRQHLGAEDGDT